MIGKVCRRGTDVRRLLGYLFLEGVAGERGLASDHTDAHLIAGYTDVAALEPQRRPDGRADVKRLAALLSAPVLAGNVDPTSKPVYHLAISAAKADRPLTDAEWADIATEYVDRIGLAPRGDDAAVRWVAVRHAPGHVHVVATLVRQDGRRVFPRQDFLRSRDASRTVEARYGLVTTAPVGGTSTPETSRAERRKHERDVNRSRRQGRPAPVAPDREVLRARVRDALAGSTDWDTFVDRLRADGVLVRPRLSTTHPGEITGYAVALPPHDSDDGRAPVWFGGGKLAPDLTLPRLQARWVGSPLPQDRTRLRRPAGPVEEAVFAVRTAERDLDVRARIGGPGAAADAAAGVSHVLHVVSRHLEGRRGGPLREAAEDYDRATRPARGRRSRTFRDRSLHAVARSLLAAAFAPNHPGWVQLLEALARLARTVAALREQQDQVARARAATLAAQRLEGDAAARGERWSVPARTVSQRGPSVAARPTHLPPRGRGVSR